MQHFNRACGQGGSGAARRLLSVRGRMRIVAVVVVVGLVFGVVAAVGALHVTDTAYGTDALAAENGGQRNSAFGYAALAHNTTGIYNTATGFGALYFNTTGTSDTAIGHAALNYNSTGSGNTAVGDQAGKGDHSNTTGSNNTFLGYYAGQGTDTQLDNATAIGANAVVSQSDSLILGAFGVNVGINTATPQSRFQIGNGTTTTWGEYLQVPVVNNTDKRPPDADCNATTLVGRMVIQQVKKKMTLWGCSSAGVWVKI